MGRLDKKKASLFGLPADVLEKSYFVSVVLPDCGFGIKSWYNMEEICKILGVCRTTIWRWNADRTEAGKRIRIVTVGRDVRIYLSELVLYFQPYDLTREEVSERRAIRKKCS